MLVQGKRPGGGSSSDGVELPGSHGGGQCTRGGRAAQACHVGYMQL